MERKTEEIGSNLPEQLVFTPAEAELCLRALSWRLMERMKSQTNLGDFDVLAYGSYLANTDATTERIESALALVEAHGNIAKKLFEAVTKNGTPAELSPTQVGTLSDVLRGFGTIGLSGAQRRAEWLYKVAPDPEEAVKEAKSANSHIAAAAFNLFKQIEPIAKSKSNVEWVAWEEAE